VLTLVRQRTDGDCGVAALATLLSRPYEEVQAAAASIDRVKRGLCGMRVRDLAQVARQFGFELEWRRRYELDDDAGLLVVRGPHTARDGHAVAAYGGFVFDPLEHHPEPWRDYQTRYRARFTTLLRVA
jgi:Peptidase C39 family